MVATASLEDEHLDETISTCKFAQVRQAYYYYAYTRTSSPPHTHVHGMNMCGALFHRHVLTCTGPHACRICGSFVSLLLLVLGWLVGCCDNR